MCFPVRLITLYTRIMYALNLSKMIWTCFTFIHNIPHFWNFYDNCWLAINLIKTFEIIQQHL